MYELYCFLMGFIAFWTCSIKLLTYLLTYLLINMRLVHLEDVKNGNVSTVNTVEKIISCNL